MILILLKIILLESCATKRRCNEKFPPQSSVEVKVIYKDTSTITPEKEAVADFPPAKPGDTSTVQDPATKIIIKTFWLKGDSIRVLVRVPPDTIQVRVPGVEVSSTKPCPPGEESINYKIWLAIILIILAYLYGRKYKV